MIKIYFTLALMSVSAAAIGERLELRITSHVAIFSNALPVQIWPAGCETHNEHDNETVFTRCFELKWLCTDEVRFQWYELSETLSNYEISIKNSSGVEIDTVPFSAMQVGSRAVYGTSFTGDEYDLCGETVSFAVVNTDTNEEIGKSDPHSFVSSYKGSLLVKYYHHMNAFGLMYQTSISPDPYFYIRIPAGLFHQRFPSELQDVVLSDQIVTVNTTMFKQRILEIDFMPYYMHEKMNLILQHQFVEIFNKRWKKREGYEIQEGNRKQPFKRASCWLNEESYVQRSVI